MSNVQSSGEVDTVDALTVITDIFVILGVTVPVLIWAWRKVTQVVADQKREREQTIVAVAAIANKVEQLEQALIFHRERRVQLMADELVKAKEQNEQLGVVQTALGELQDTVLKLQATQVRVEGEQQQAIDKLRTDIAQLRERVMTLTRGFLPRP